MKNLLSLFLILAFCCVVSWVVLGILGMEEPVRGIWLIFAAPVKGGILYLEGNPSNNNLVSLCVSAITFCVVFLSLLKLKSGIALVGMVLRITGIASVLLFVYWLWGLYLVVLG